MCLITWKPVILLQGDFFLPCKQIWVYSCKYRGIDPSFFLNFLFSSVLCSLAVVFTSLVFIISGIRSSGGQMSASFTSDGKHIISTSEDSTVYVWNHDSLHGPTSRQVKSIRSCERFFSSNASVAIPWSGMKSKDSDSCSSGTLEFNPHCFGNSTGNFESSCHWHSDSLHNALSMSSLDSSLGHAFFSEAIPKGSATWPEEKLPASSSLFVPSSMCKSQYKFLKASCQNMVASPHAWGLVIITAGWDGRIRSFHNYGLPVGFWGSILGTSVSVTLFGHFNASTLNFLYGPHLAKIRCCKFLTNLGQFLRKTSSCVRPRQVRMWADTTRR